MKQILLSFFCLLIATLGSAQAPCLGSLSMVLVQGNATSAPVKAVPLTSVPFSCATGTFATLDANGQNGSAPLAYNWSTGATSQTVSNISPATYTVVVTDANNCTGSGSVQVVQIGAAAVSIAGNTLIGCAPTSTTLTATSGFNTYAWSDGTTVTPALATSAGGTYTVNVAFANGCTAASTVVVTLDQTIPTPTIAASSLNLDCATLSETLTAGGGSSYAWSTGATATSTGAPTATVMSDGTYTVTVSAPNGCTATTDVVMGMGCQVFTSAPGCMLAATATGVNGTGWHHLVNSNGRILASINSNGNDLGTVNLNFDNLAGPIFYAGDWYLPRHFEFTPQNNGPWTTPVTVRLYFMNNELVATNATDPSPIYTRSDLYVIHYDDINTDCTLTNDNTAAFDVFTPPVVVDNTFGPGAFWLQVAVTDFSEFVARGTNVALLPVGLLYFKGRAQENDNILNWESATEQNSAFFAVERSYDGMVFKEIGRKKAAGNSTINQLYDYTDANAPLHAYYRLRMIDRDGTYAFSNTIYLERTKGKIGITNVYPVPTEDKVNVEFELADAAEVTIILTDILGKQITTQTMKAIKGINAQIIDLSALPSGVYNVILDADKGKRVTRKVIKS